MRLIKVLGLAVVGAAIGMAFIGASSASAQDKIVLCKELIEVGKLCPTGKLWPKGTKLFALAKNPELDNSFGFGTIKCEDSLVTGELAEEIGLPLNIAKPEATFGILPKPTLGANCTGSCTNGAEENIHVLLENLKIEDEATDKFYLVGTGLALLLHCPGNITCIYRGENIKVPIEHKGEHPLDKEAKNLPLAKYEVVLPLAKTHIHEKVEFKSSIFCPGNSTWLADYVLYKAESGGVSGLAWPALDLP